MMFLEELSYAQQGCIWLKHNNRVILWNITILKYQLSILIY